MNQSLSLLTLDCDLTKDTHKQIITNHKKMNLASLETNSIPILRFYASYGSCYPSIHNLSIQETSLLWDAQNTVKLLGKGIRR